MNLLSIRGSIERLSVVADGLGYFLRGGSSAVCILEIQLMFSLSLI